MQTLDIVLQKRKSKATLFIGGLLFAILILLIATPELIRGANWGVVASFLLILTFALMMAYSLRQYFYKEVRLIVDSDGSTITIYNINEAGKIFNKIVVKDTPKLTRFYTVRTRTRYLMSKYSYTFEGQSWLSGVQVHAFPSLFEATEADRNKVLVYVKMIHPDIELGYQSAWSKASKK
jgi:hypothetical protein